MPKVQVHKIASSTAGTIAGREIEIGEGRAVRVGDVVVVEALEEKSVYDQLELVTGRMAKISKGDVIAGALGARKALKGFVGHVPKEVRAGETLHVLNLGGVIGIATSANRDFGEPLKVKLLGVAVRDGATVNITDGATPPADRLTCQKPIVLVAGTCMNAGKTRAACEIISRLNQKGYRVGAMKVSGVACLKDTLNMEDHGAVDSLSFLDAGHPSTAGFEDLVPMARGLLNEMGHKDIHCIVVELGDGIIGGYGVASLYKDAAIVKAVRAHVLCANDLVAAWGARELSIHQLGRPIDVMSGPATDNDVGERYVEDELEIPAANARTRGAKLAEIVEAKLFPK
ncbi:MAG TPA: hypothetical protein VHF22_15370 [Planctomycetota bacterium]|nr:hypothetical protein [Planctomycetota bacterium]